MTTTLPPNSPVTLEELWNLDIHIKARPREVRHRTSSTVIEWHIDGDLKPTINFGLDRGDDVDRRIFLARLLRATMFARHEDLTTVFQGSLAYIPVMTVRLLTRCEPRRPDHIFIQGCGIPFAAMYIWDDNALLWQSPFEEIVNSTIRLANAA